jgi:hypothetical protein
MLLNRFPFIFTDITCFFFFFLNLELLEFFKYTDRQKKSATLNFFLKCGKIVKSDGL